MKAANEHIHLVIHPLVLTFAQTECDLQIFIDAGDTQISWFLLQKQSEVINQPIAYWSRPEATVRGAWLWRKRPSLL